jgi:chromate transporter
MTVSAGVGVRDNRTKLGELAFVFARLGATAFGGPAAHIAMMQEEVVRRRAWMTNEEFLDLLGATNLIPGPNSTEMAIHVGHRRAGWAGLLVAGSCFILPASVIVLAIAWAYVRFHSLPEAGALLYGIKPVIIAVVLQALWGLARTAVKSWILVAVGVATTAATLLGANELVLLLAAGATMVVVARARRPRAISSAALTFVPGVPLAAAAASAGASFNLGILFLSFLKVGALLFGSGYVLLAFLRADLVDRLHWLTEGQLLDAIAVGQVTPGPVSTTATFIGYVLGGTSGAVVATAGIFLPAFVFVALSGPLIPLLRRSKVAGAFLDGVNVASLALMAAVTWQLGRAAIVDIPTFVISVLGAFVLLRYRVNSAWLLGVGALSGLVLRMVQ